VRTVVNFTLSLILTFLPGEKEMSYGSTVASMLRSRLLQRTDAPPNGFYSGSAFKASVVKGNGRAPRVARTAFTSSAVTGLCLLPHELRM
jgi:hypothetical protein